MVTAVAVARAATGTITQLKMSTILRVKSGLIAISPRSTCRSGWLRRNAYRRDAISLPLERMSIELRQVFLGEDELSLAPARSDVTKMQAKIGAIPGLEPARGIAIARGMMPNFQGVNSLGA